MELEDGEQQARSVSKNTGTIWVDTGESKRRAHHTATVKTHVGNTSAPPTDSQQRSDDKQQETYHITRCKARKHGNLA